MQLVPRGYTVVYKLRRSDWYSVLAMAALALQLFVGAMYVHAQAQTQRTREFEQAILNQAHTDKIETLSEAVRRIDIAVAMQGDHLGKLDVAVGSIEETRRLEYGIVFAVVGQLTISLFQIFKPSRRNI